MTDHQDNPAGPLSFELDIRPLFRDKDRNAMLKAFDLWSYADVMAHQDASSSAAPAAADQRRDHMLRAALAVIVLVAGLPFAAWQDVSRLTADAMHLKRPGLLPTSMPVGGIITPQ